MGREVMEGLRFLASLLLAGTGQREGGGFSCINKRIISHPVTSPFPLHVSLFPDEDLEARDSHNLRDYTFVYEGSFRNTKDLQKP